MGRGKVRKKMNPAKENALPNVVHLACRQRRRRRRDHHGRLGRVEVVRVEIDVIRSEFVGSEVSNPPQPLRIDAIQNKLLRPELCLDVRRDLGGPRRRHAVELVARLPAEDRRLVLECDPGVLVGMVEQSADVILKQAPVSTQHGRKCTSHWGGYVQRGNTDRTLGQESTGVGGRRRSPKTASKAL